MQGINWTVDETRGRTGKRGLLLACLMVWSSAVVALQRVEQSRDRSAVEWSTPSQCSRSCGGGVTFRDRICRANSSCPEPRRVYVICNVQACPDGSLDFRAEQCANNNNVSTDGEYFEWLPYSDDDDQCALKCLAKGERIHRRLVARVIDGTKCGPNGLDVCVNGTCKSVGCDGVLDSGKQLDACLRCHSSDSRCLTFHGTLSISGSPRGYSKLLSLPQGATSITLQKNGGSRHYLVLRDHDGSYHRLRYGSRLEFGSSGVRDISINGIVLLYDRLESGVEYLTAVGPLNHSLSVELLKEWDNEPVIMSVSYDYSVGSQHQSSSSEQFAWMAGSWTACSSHCETVSSKRNITCIRVSTREIVDEMNCELRLRPSTQRQCGLRPCQTRWVVGQWEQCSQSCGPGGVQQRAVVCEKVLANGQMMAVASNQCPLPKPLTAQPCNVHINCPEWEMGNWSQCNRVCGIGTQFRQVLCRAKHPIAGAKTDILPNIFCSQKSRPSERRSCDAGPCDGVGWIATEWSGCPDTCDNSSETRLVVCSTRNGVIRPDVECHPSKKLIHLLPCSIKGTCIPKPQWFTSSWSQCTTKCGKGMQHRSVFCGASDGVAVVKLDEIECHLEPRPEVELECLEQKCDGAWFVGPFGKCSVSCGEGRRSRKVFCLAGDRLVEFSKCDRHTRPDVQEDCNEMACDDDEFMRYGSLDCKATEHGCCPDGVTAADGPMFLGCSSGSTSAGLCIESEYGCCRDGVTSADGPFHEGCDVPSCEQTQFGCCDDGQTPAQDSLGDGCPTRTTITCEAMAFGCCSDGLSPANGFNSEGCKAAITTVAPYKEISCEETKYGCCPDGITPLQGLLEEGCSGNVEVVQETSGEVSDCYISAFGCCPDQVTAAEGPGFTGCLGTNEMTEEQPESAKPCIESYFGCCPDGISTATGPDGWGCPQVAAFTYQPTSSFSTIRSTTTSATTTTSPSASSTSTFRASTIKPGKAKPRHGSGGDCASSVHGCCLDGKTHASGWSFEGCQDVPTYVETCQDSQFGCCPDGLSSAAGPNYAHCPTLVKKGAACMMEKFTGPCDNYAVHWYFDKAYGGCARFWYGGCEGNDNRFETKEECHNACVSPKGLLDRCYLPQSVGPCRESLVRYSYDPSTQQCVQMNYSGCLGNDNRFASLELCEEACVERQKPVLCSQPALQGPCRGVFQRWYFDKQLDACRPFVYGGCKGNDNRFDRREECEKQCKRSIVYDKCRLSHDSGTCSSQIDQWYFDSRDGFCKLFLFSGCGGNENRFDSESDCQEACNATQQPTDVCKLPVESGQCGHAFRRFSFYGGRCAAFTFSGCGGNRNNFRSMEECRQKCPHYTHITTAERGRCHLPIDLGPCISNLTRWYYSALAEKCMRFVYGGCGGNRNRFHTEELCKLTCQRSLFLVSSTSAPLIGSTSNDIVIHTVAKPAEADLREIIKKEAETGDGSNNEDDEYYDEHDMTTTVAPITKSARLTTSGKSTKTTNTIIRTTPMASKISGGTIAVCGLHSDPGPCRSATIRWHYDGDKGECVRFQYGGCDGNGNNFLSKRDCENVCSVQEVCHLPFHSGSCDGTKKRFYYDVASDKCQQFIYSGCNGNANRFLTIENCERVCRKVHQTVKQSEVDPTRIIPTVATASKVAITTAASSTRTFSPSRTGVCSLGKDTGPCKNFSSAWYFEPVARVCRRFLYGGCGGNGNQFTSAHECWSRCLSTTSSMPATVAATVMASAFTTAPLASTKGSNEPQDPPSYMDICELKVDMGEYCLKWVEHWYYDSALSKCRLFYYGGCYGNENRFKTEAECLFVCAGHVDTNTKQIPINAGATLKPVTDLKAKTTQKATSVQDVKSGQCPTFDADYMLAAGCLVECKKDEDCDEKLKCCSTGCGAVCAKPTAQKQAPILEARPKIEPHNSSIVSFKSSNVMLPCRAQGVPQPRVAWFKSRQLITDSATMKNRFAILPDGSLLIQDVTAGDAGSYSCRAYNSLGAATQSYTLTINVPAQIEEISGPTEVVADLGSTVEFGCRASGYPFPTVKWRREDSILSVDGRRLRQTFEFLQISNVQETDSGAYVCEASNGFGEPQTRRYRLTVFVPMYVTLTISPRSNVKEEEDVLLQCHVENTPVGENSLTHAWSFNGKPLRPNDRYREKKLGQLLIRNVTLDDAGNFGCMATKGKQKASSGIVTLSVQASSLPANCTDRSWYANCQLIVEGELCQHPYFKVFCCKSCHMSGQLL